MDFEKRKQEVLKSIERNQFEFHFKLECGKCVTNRNIDDFPEIKKMMIKNIDILIGKDNEILSPEQASIQFLKLFQKQENV